MVNKLSHVRKLFKPEDFLKRSFVFVYMMIKSWQFLMCAMVIFFANLNFRAYLIALRTAFC